MEKLEIIGRKKLSGNISISGSKNATLPILAATILSNKKILIKIVLYQEKLKNVLYLPILLFLLAQ